MLAPTVKKLPSKIGECKSASVNKMSSKLLMLVKDNLAFALPVDLLVHF